MVVLNYFPDSSLYSYIKIEGAGRLANNVEINSGGVYAWYLPSPTMKSDLSISEINHYYSSVSDAIYSENAQTQRLRINVALNTNPIKPSGAAENYEQVIKSFIGVSGLFSAPVYVGSTVEQGISERVRQHLRIGAYKEKLLQRIRESGFDDNVYPEVMLVRYFPVDSFLSESEISINVSQRKALIEQIEETIFSIKMPPLNERRGR